GAAAGFLVGGMDAGGAVEGDDVGFKGGGGEFADGAVGVDGFDGLFSAGEGDFAVGGDDECAVVGAVGDGAELVVVLEVFVHLWLGGDGVVGVGAEVPVFDEDEFLAGADVEGGCGAGGGVVG